MKKLLARALALSMTCALLLTGCGNSGSGNSGNSANAATSGSGETNWPTGTVTVILPYGAGGDTDTYCRQLFQRIGSLTGQTFVVTNEEGGSGVVAAMEVMNKPTDGNTLLFNHTGASLVQEAIGTVDFSYTTDFANCATVAIDETYALVAVAPGGTYSQYMAGPRLRIC